VDASHWAAVEHIHMLAGRWRRESDGALRELTTALKKAAQAAESADAAEVLVPALSLATEAARRALGIEFYDVQLLAGLVLARGGIAQVQTGEGKTFITALPAVCFALRGRGVHLMTTNCYLAERDYALLSPMYALLGISAGVLHSAASPDDKRAAYACDITYGPGYEFGFDYLRDRLAGLTSRRQLGDVLRQRLRGGAAQSGAPLQRPCAFAVVDEADSVMIDEATTPLILNQAGEPSNKHSEVYRLADDLAAQLQPNRDFQLDGDGRALCLTPAGLDRARQTIQAITADGLRRSWPQYVEQALRARWLHKKEVDYVIQDGKVRLVDAHTGRIHENRSLRHGLQQALEAAEGVTITAESAALAHISRQRYFRLYDRLCGTTGTVENSQREFWREYRLPVVVIPTHRPCQRRDLTPRSFADRPAKFAAIVADVLRLQQLGQPVLVGAPTIWQSREIAQRLAAAGGAFQLLNGQQDAAEADIIAQAGRPGAVTIATNMAGRGTDIKLGPGVAALGGLHVIVAEPNLSARSDRQLIGRAARQGDPGSSQTFVSGDDDLVCRFGPSLGRRMKRLAARSGEVASGEIQRDLSRAIRRLQRQADLLAEHVRRQQSLHDERVEDLVGSLAVF
jgi:preprotein translocase subunit SecA